MFLFSKNFNIIRFQYSSECFIETSGESIVLILTKRSPNAFIMSIQPINPGDNIFQKLPFVFSSDLNICFSERGLLHPITLSSINVSVVSESLSNLLDSSLFSLSQNPVTSRPQNRYISSYSISDLHFSDTYHDSYYHLWVLSLVVFLLSITD